jgi:hypothetical protein
MDLIPGFLAGSAALMLCYIYAVRPKQTKMWFAEVLTTIFGSWLQRKKRKRIPPRKHESIAFPPEVVQYYRQRSESRQQLQQLWLERFIEVCDSLGVRVPDEILPPHSPLRRTLRIYSDAETNPVHTGYDSLHGGGFRPGFHPHPPVCPGDFDMEEIFGNAGEHITTYTHCKLCNWSVNMSAAEVLQQQQLLARGGRYSGPIDGHIGEKTLAAMWERDELRRKLDFERQRHRKMYEKYKALRAEDL